MRRLFENLSTLLFGIFIGALGVIVHNFFVGWFPVGLILSLLGTLAASRLVGIHYGRRGVRLWFLLGWSFISLRGGIFGNSDELLIMANGAGNAFLGLGFLLLIVSIWARI